MHGRADNCQMFQPSQHDVRSFFCGTWRKQREGLPLRRIQAMPEEAQREAVAGVPGRELVMRIAVAPGITLELALGSGGEMPDAEQLKELAQSCARVLGRKPR